MEFDSLCVCVLNYVVCMCVYHTSILSWPRESNLGKSESKSTPKRRPTQ